MNVYRIDIKICGTAYIKAKSEKEALKIAKGLEDLEPGEEVPISGESYDSPNLPDVSLSPAMTIHGPWDDDDVELVETL